MSKLKRSVNEMRHVYRDFLAEKGVEDNRLCALEADLAGSMATAGLGDYLGDRFINVGIMEAQMISTAAGLSSLGFKPYVHTFGPFATRRCFDQLFLSLGYSQLAATIVGSDSGVTAEHNGGTHMPFEELALVRSIPNINVYEVSDDIQFKAVLDKTFDSEELNYIRTIRKEPYPIYKDGTEFKDGYVELVDGTDVNILASGIMVEEALKASESLKSEGISARVIDVYRIKPISKKLLDSLEKAPIVTAENHNVIGGLGSAISDELSESSCQILRRVGVKEQFGQVGKLDWLKEYYGLTSQAIVEQAKKAISLSE